MPLRNSCLWEQPSGLRPIIARRRTALLISQRRRQRIRPPTKSGQTVPFCLRGRYRRQKIAGTASALTVRGGTYDFYAVSPARPLQQPTGNNNYQITDIRHKEDVMTSFQRNVTVMATSNTVTLNTFMPQMRPCRI